MGYGNENGFDLSMPVAPVNYGNNNGNGFGGDNGWWILLLFLFGMNGGWGNGGGYGGGNQLYPWMNQADITTSGFQNQMLNTQLIGLQNSVTNGFAQDEIGENARQMANMQQLFGLQSAMQECCCENRAGNADLKYTIATEACATRAASTANTQAILDKLCQLELDGVKGQLAQAQRENVGLQNQLNMATMRESQAAQNAFIQQGLNNEVDQLYNRLSNCPVPSVPVYGRQPIFSCNNNGCGCGCGGNGLIA